MINTKLNKNLKIIFTSITLTIIGSIILGIITRYGRMRNIAIFNSSPIVNTLLESMIVFIQYLTIKIYNNGKFTMDSIGLDCSNKKLKYILSGMIFGILNFSVLMIALYIMGYAKYEGSGFGHYPTNVLIDFVFNVFIMAIFAAVCEEIFFRGVLLNYLNKYKGKTFAVIVSSLIFSLPHFSRYGSLTALAYIFIMGIVLGYCYIITQSLYVSIGLHFTTNFLTSLINPGQISVIIIELNPNITSDQLSIIIFIVYSVINLITATALVILDKKIKNKKKVIDSIY
ncbi:hypothetical protein CSC2_08580 [Clostridium zeae]|uniref:CAAX prenyl protease 2/Lysostaphin resistance protein A-like domain-containing protein n=1 Tax=Clostridium zeae TaxID=2759022 RepID=A0ABQ1E6C8_9CLOT|nr:CPBP family intramembrane glutamic endopeptidase [Clostridium zeae]GFZ30332.1 hypothetical protein CSC2_08580 [Clostridium zeae]